MVQDDSGEPAQQPSRQPRKWWQRTPRHVSAKQEIQLAASRGLVACNTMQGVYWVIQIVMPDESNAKRLMDLIIAEHEEPNDLLVRQSPTQQGRWVVQLPVGEAERLGLLPRGVKFSNIKEKLPYGTAPGDPNAPHQPRRGFGPSSR